MQDSATLRGWLAAAYGAQIAELEAAERDITAPALLKVLAKEKGLVEKITDKQCEAMDKACEKELEKHGRTSQYEQDVQEESGEDEDEEAEEAEDDDEEEQEQEEEDEGGEAAEDDDNE